MKKSASLIILGMALGTLMATPCAAQSSSTLPSSQPAPQPSSWDEWVKKIKSPCNEFTWGADVRLRNEYFNNALSLREVGVDGRPVDRHEQDYFRFRERLWASVMPVTNLSVNARLATEQREWMKPTFVKQHSNRSGLEERYVILDAANVKWNNIMDSPLSITAGRQDIMLGDPLNWWLVLDGTPYDGSWTMFFDAVRLTYTADEIKTKFDLIYLNQSALPDDRIPTLGRSSENRTPAGASPYWLTEQNEQGVIAYLSNKSLKNMQVDGYFIYKRDTQEEAIRSPYNTPLGDNAEIYTIGGKITGNPVEHLRYSAEGAYQFGHKEDPTVRNPVASISSRPIEAFGVNASLTYLCKDEHNNQGSIVFEFLSGDDPNSRGTDEMFDILWGRWPRWSELYIYSYPNETSGKFAQLNNIMRIGPSWSFSPKKNTTFSVMYNALVAPEDTPTRALSPSSFNPTGGHFRGHYLQAVLRKQFNKYISAHLWSEFVWEGDYYARRDLMTFLRAEVMFTF